MFDFESRNTLSSAELHLCVESLVKGLRKLTIDGKNVGPPAELALELLVQRILKQATATLSKNESVVVDS